MQDRLCSKESFELSTATDEHYPEEALDSEPLVKRKLSQGQASRIKTTYKTKGNSQTTRWRKPSP